MAALPAGELYAITDRALSLLPNPEQVQAMLRGGARVIQLRDKNADDAAFLRDALEIRSLTREAGAIFILNDRMGLVSACEADGVHLGQDDIAPRTARAMLGTNVTIGLSTHNRAQLEAALREPIDYVAVGPVFGTTTKKNPDPPTGVELVRVALRLAGALPVVAIGGIDETNCGEIPAGALLAVIGGICKSADIAAAVARFRRLRLPPAVA